MRPHSEHPTIHMSWLYALYAEQFCSELFVIVRICVRVDK